MKNCLGSLKGEEIIAKDVQFYHLLDKSQTRHKHMNLKGRI